MQQDTKFMDGWSGRQNSSIEKDWIVTEQEEKIFLLSLYCYVRGLSSAHGGEEEIRVRDENERLRGS